MRVFPVVAALAAAAFAASAASAETIKLTATLIGPSETPPNDSKGTGALTGTYDTDTKTLAWTVEYSGLTGPATAAHFHGPAPVGKPAPVLVPIVGSLASPFKGTATLNDDQAKALMDGMVYFNIHTDAHKAGEIRGQVEKAM